MATQTVTVGALLDVTQHAYDERENYKTHYLYQAGLITIPDPDKITDIEYTGDICLYNSSDVSLMQQGGYMSVSVYCCSPINYGTTSGSHTIDAGFWGSLVVENIKRFASGNQLLLLIKASDVDALWERNDGSALYALHNCQIVFTYSDGSTKKIYLGSTQINKIYLGSTEVKKVYICPSYSAAGKTSSTGISREGEDGKLYTVYQYRTSKTLDIGLTNVRATAPNSNLPTTISYNSSTGSATVTIYSTSANTPVTTTISAEKMLYSNS